MLDGKLTVIDGAIYNEDRDQIGYISDEFIHFDKASICAAIGAGSSAGSTARTTVYSNIESRLVATNVQDAIDEVHEEVEDNTAAISGLTTDVVDINVDLSDVHTSISGLTESLTQITELDTVSINVSGINPSSSGFSVHKKNGICYITAYLVATSTSITFSGIPKPYSGVYGLVTDTNNSTSTLFYIAGNVDNFSLSNVSPGNTYVLNVSYPHK